MVRWLCHQLLWCDMALVFAQHMSEPKVAYIMKSVGLGSARHCSVGEGRGLLHRRGDFVILHDENALQGLDANAEKHQQARTDEDVGFRTSLPAAISVNVPRDDDPVNIDNTLMHMNEDMRADDIHRYFAEHT